MTSLLELSKSLNEQLEIINLGIGEELVGSPPLVRSSASSKRAVASHSEVEQARKKALNISHTINQLLKIPSEHIVWTAHKYYDTVSLRIVIEKKIASMIPIDSRGINISEISREAGLPETTLILVLRQLAAVDIFHEPIPRIFAHTPSSLLLASPEFTHTATLLLHHMDEGFKSAAYFPEALDLYGDKFDEVQKSDLRTSFNLAFNVDLHYFDYIYAPENISRYGERFGRAMMGHDPAHLVDGVIDLYDWTIFSEGDKIVDVGGGVGHIGVKIATRVVPGVEVIVQDRPTVVEQGKLLHGKMVTFHPHDFFFEQPVKGAKMYYLRHILHDWPDDICRTILRHLYSAMNSSSKLLIFELIFMEDKFWVTEGDNGVCGEDDKHWKREMLMMNLHMKNLLGSKERTIEDWHSLLNSVGFHVSKIYQNGRTPAIIEAIKKATLGGLTTGNLDFHTHEFLENK